MIKGNQNHVLAISIDEEMNQYIEAVRKNIELLLNKEDIFPEA